MRRNRITRLPALTRWPAVAFVCAAGASSLLGVHARADTPLPSAGEFTCESAARGTCNFTDPPTEFVFAWPNDWPVRRLKLVTETGPRARARQQDAIRWISLEYVPDDPTQPDTWLLQVAVLARPDWIRQCQQPLLVTSVEVASDRRNVAIATLQPDSPYPAESRDADIFEALMPTLQEVSRIVRFGSPSPPVADGQGRVP